MVGVRQLAKGMKGMPMKSVTGDPQLERLRTAHRDLDDELLRLTRRAHMTPAEEQRVRVIKKEKLRTKDSIRLLMDGFKVG